MVANNFLLLHRIYHNSDLTSGWIVVGIVPRLPRKDISMLLENEVINRKVVISSLANPRSVTSMKAGKIEKQNLKAFSSCCETCSNQTEE